MNKFAGLAVLVAAVAAGAYFYMNSQEPQEAGMEAVESTGDAAMQEPAEQAQEAMESATESAGDAAGAVADAASEAVSGAMDAANDAVDAASEAMSEGAAATGEAMESAADAMKDMANDAMNAAGEATGMAETGPLSVEAFDAAEVIAMIEASSLAPEVKATLTAAVGQAAENPDLVPGVVAQVKTALGM